MGRRRLPGVPSEGPCRRRPDRPHRLTHGCDRALRRLHAPPAGSCRAVDRGERFERGWRRVDGSHTLDPGLTALRGGRPLQIMPMAARIEQGAQRDELNRFKRKLQTCFGKYLPEAAGDPVSSSRTPRFPIGPTTRSRNASLREKNAACVTRSCIRHTRASRCDPARIHSDGTAHEPRRGAGRHRARRRSGDDRGPSAMGSTVLTPMERRPTSLAPHSRARISSTLAWTGRSSRAPTCGARA